MRVRILLQLTDDDGSAGAAEEIATFAKATERPEDLGLSIAEGKALLAAVQHRTVVAQVAEWSKRHRCCATCGERRRVKGSYPTTFHTLYGAVELNSPRLHRCACQGVDGPATVSPLRALDQTRACTNASGVTRLAIDETAARRGHDYVTLFVDIDQARVVFATEGKGADTIATFANDLAAHGGDPESINIDMSPAFIKVKGTAENLPNAAVTFDKFHAVKIINDAVEYVRRDEQKTQSLLRGTRYI